MTSTLSGKRPNCLLATGATVTLRAAPSILKTKDSGACPRWWSSRLLMDTSLSVSTLEPPAETEHVMWFDKFSENWTRADSEEQLTNILQNEREKMIFIDFYAGFCGSCKAAYPQLSRIAGNPDFQKDYLFVKCDVTSGGIKDFVRRHGINGIPTAMVCAPGGEKLITFGCSFRKINAVKANLVVMAANKRSEFAIDPNGFVMPRPE